MDRVPGTPSGSAEAFGRGLPFGDVYTDLEVVGSPSASPHRCAGAVASSWPASLLPGCNSWPRRGSSDLYLAVDEHTSSPESTEGQLGDFVVALTLRGTRLVGRRSRSIHALWGHALTFVALITIVSAVAAAEICPIPWARSSTRFVGTASGHLPPLEDHLCDRGGWRPSGLSWDWPEPPTATPTSTQHDRGAGMDQEAARLVDRNADHRRTARPLGAPSGAVDPVRSSAS